MTYLNLNFEIVRDASWSHGNNMIFHYTTAQNANSIIMEKKIRENCSINGIGVFLTTLSPNSSDTVISKNNFGPNHYTRKMQKCECAFGFFRKDLINLDIIQDNRYGFMRDITRHNGDIDLTRKRFYLIVRPICGESLFKNYIACLKHC